MERRALLARIPWFFLLCWGALGDDDEEDARERATQRTSPAPKKIPIVAFALSQEGCVLCIALSNKIYDAIWYLMVNGMVTDAIINLPAQKFVRPACVDFWYCTHSAPEYGLGSGEGVDSLKMILVMSQISIGVSVVVSASAKLHRLVFYVLECPHI